MKTVTLSFHSRSFSSKEIIFTLRSWRNIREYFFLNSNKYIFIRSYSLYLFVTLGKILFPSILILWKFIVTFMDGSQWWIAISLDPNQLCIISRADLETSPRFRKCNGSGFGFSTFREPVTVSLSLLSRAIAIVFITRLTPRHRIVRFHGIKINLRDTGSSSRYSWFRIGRRTSFCRSFWPRNTRELAIRTNETFYPIYNPQ